MPRVAVTIVFLGGQARPIGRAARTKDLRGHLTFGMEQSGLRSNMLRPMRFKRLLLCLLATWGGVICGLVVLYARWIGWPRKIEGYWAHPHVTWYWTGYPPLGYPFPGVVQYVYTDAAGDEVKHGPLLEHGVRGNGVFLARTGFYFEDPLNGLFTEYQTYWGTKSKDTWHDHGKVESSMFYPVPNLEPCNH